MYTIKITERSLQTVRALLLSYIEDSEGTQEPEESRIDALQLSNILNNAQPDEQEHIRSSEGRYKRYY